MGGVGGVIHNTINKYYRRTRNNNSFFFRVTLIGMITKIYKIQEVQYYKMKRKHLQWYVKQYFLKAK